MHEGRVHDIMGNFVKSQEAFGQAYRHMQRELETVKGRATPEQVQEMGEIEFRYGWALIRSEKDVKQGVDLMKKADVKVPNNCDLKTKLVQVLNKFEYPIPEGIKYIMQIFALQDPDPTTLQLHAKLLIRKRDGVLAAEQAERALYLMQFQDCNDEPTAGTYYMLGQAYELQKQSQ